MNHNQIIEVIAAHRDGKEWEYHRQGDYRSPGDQSLTNLLSYASCYPVRIKPTPAKRLVTLEELPYVFETLENKPNPACRDSSFIHLWRRDDFTPRMIQRCADIKAQFTTDGKTWKSFEVEA